MKLTPQKIESYAHRHTRPEPAMLTRLEKKTYAEMKWPQMLTGRLEGRFLKLLVQMTRAKRVLEIGTFTGYSALSMAEGLPKGGKVVTCEANPANAAFAKKFFAQSPHGNKIELRLGPALASLRKEKELFDLIFIDADKKPLLVYYELSLRRLNRGGIIAVDNCLWSGRVLKPGDADTRAIHRLNRRAAHDPRVENVILTVRDGVNLIRKK